MNILFKRALLFLIVVFALLGILAVATNAPQALSQLRLDLFIVSCFFFLVSVLFWLISWAHLIKKHSKTSLPDLLLVGFGALYGALTPIQLGSEAIRSIKLKEKFKIPYSDSVSASMVVKGIKFLILALVASFLLFFYMINTQVDSLLFFGFLSGFVMVLLAVFIFLLPLNKNFGLSIAGFFKRLSDLIPVSIQLSKFFEHYSFYLEKLKLRSFAFVFIFVFASWCFEFLALQYALMSLGVFLQFEPIVVLLILFSILERTPFLPRGIGLVELVGYNFLAFPQFAKYSMTVSQIGGVIIVYDLVRLVIPTIFSMLLNLFLKGIEHKNKK